MKPRERRALRVLAVTAAWVVGVPLGLVGAGAVVAQVQAYRQHDREDERAGLVLRRWADAVGGTATGTRRFVPVGDLTGQEGTWPENGGDDAERALLAGHVVVAPGLGLPPGPRDGTIRWADGTTATVPLLSAADGVRALREAVPLAERDCHGCHDLVVTDAVLGETRLDTDAGPATVPVWRYTLDGTTPVRVTRVAVSAGGAAVVPALPPDRSTRTVVVPDGWTVSPDGSTLTVGFFGAAGPGSDPCGADYTGQAVESASGVVVVVRQAPGYWRDVVRIASLHLSFACPAIAASRTVDVRLGAPLRDRTVLDLVTGTPLRRGLPGPPG